LTSKKAKELRSEEFAKQFYGLSFSDFENYNPKTQEGGSEKIKNIKNPNPDDDTDFKAALRAVKKNMILAEIFSNPPAQNQVQHSGGGFLSGQKDGH